MGIKKLVRTWMTKALVAHGYEVRAKFEQRQYPTDFTSADIAVLEIAKPYSMVPVEGLLEFRRAVQHVVRSDVPGAIVECGVCRGGAMMTVACTLKEMQTVRDLYLFDTFEGMPASGERDVDFAGRQAETRRKANEPWCYGSIEEVTANLRSTGYDMNRVRFVKGKVEDTLPAASPESIALLRLDTDFYDSTYHELVHLYPRLASGGILIIDDYGYWQGSREAVDEYLQKNGVKIFLGRTTSSIRIAVKP